MRLLMRTDPMARWLVISIVAALGIAVAWFGFHQLSVAATLFGGWLGGSIAILTLHRLKHSTPAWFDGAYVLLLGLTPLYSTAFSNFVLSLARRSAPVLRQAFGFF